MGFGILSLFVTLFGVRDRSPLSVSVMWTLPVMIATLGLTLVLDGNNYVGLGMAFLAALLSFALVIARRTPDLGYFSRTAVAISTVSSSPDRT